MLGKVFVNKTLCLALVHKKRCLVNKTPRVFNILELTRRVQLYASRLYAPRLVLYESRLYAPRLVLYESRLYAPRLVLYESRLYAPRLVLYAGRV